MSDKNEFGGTSFGDNEWGITVDMNGTNTNSGKQFSSNGNDDAISGAGVGDQPVEPQQQLPSSSKKSHKKKNNKPKPIELGFVEEFDDQEADSLWKLTSPFFPSKLGGKPSWLDLKNLPDIKKMKCSSCDGPTKFLLQVYAPLDNSSAAFHRTIFIFVCTNQQCCVERNSSKNLIALRCQLELKNEFYSSEAPCYNDPTLSTRITPEMWDVKLCNVCGCKGSSHCSKCKRVNYCSKEHQLLDWKAGHKGDCDNPDFKPSPISSHKSNFKEYEIVIDKEIIPKGANETKEKKDALEEYKKLVEEGKAGTLGNDVTSTKELLEAASYKSDKAFNKFRKRIAFNPDQVLRYDRGGEPLWVSSEKVPSAEDIPNCSYCKGSRVFEFQVMPQLLNYLGEDSRSGSLDWGTFVIYTCESSCADSESDPYKIEFIWLQHFKEDSKDED